MFRNILKGGVVTMAIQPVTLDKVSPTTPAPSVTSSSNNGHTKNIQSQITSKQQHLKQISSDDTITATEKEEKRRELQREIDELNRKLELKKQEQKEKAEEAAKKQQQADARKAETQKKASSTSEAKEDSSTLSKKEENTEKATEARQDTQKADLLKAEQQKTDMSIKEIQQMLSADYLIQKDLVQEQVDAKIENTIHVLESEIHQDKMYGADTTKKETELDTLQSKENFWTEAQKTKEVQKQAQEQTHMQSALNANAKIVTDQM